MFVTLNKYGLRLIKGQFPNLLQTQRAYKLHWICTFSIGELIHFRHLGHQQRAAFKYVYLWYLYMKFLYIYKCQALYT